jgi:hypothetical protein
VDNTNNWNDWIGIGGYKFTKKIQCMSGSYIHGKETYMLPTLIPTSNRN